MDLSIDCVDLEPPLVLFLPKNPKGAEKENDPIWLLSITNCVVHEAVKVGEHYGVIKIAFQKARENLENWLIRVETGESKTNCVVERDSCVVFNYVLAKTER